MITQELQTKLATLKSWHTFAVDLIPRKKLTFTSAKTRRSFLLHLVHQDGITSLSEVALLPGWHKYSEDEFKQVLAQTTVIKPELNKTLATNLNRFPALQYLLHTALLILEAGLQKRNWYRLLQPMHSESDTCQVCGLLYGEPGNWAGEITDLNKKFGIKVFKVKVGRLSAELEISTIQKLLTAFPNITLRLDANQLLDVNTSEPWLQLLNNSRIEYVEEPFRDWSESTIARWHNLLQKTAVDESLSNPSGPNPGQVHVIKPGIYGWPVDLNQTVISSSFESNYGLAILGAIAQNGPAAGLGTMNIFENDFCGPLEISSGSINLNQTTLQRTAELKLADIRNFARELVL